MKQSLEWVVLSYSLPSSSGTSSPRVAAWRRLKRLGAISPVSTLHLLPALDECVEGFQWLAQEVRQAGGEAVMFRVGQIEGFTSEQLMRLFCEARAKDYAVLEQEAADLEPLLADETRRVEAQGAIPKLYRQFREIRDIDYFNCAEGARLQSQLERLNARLNERHADANAVPRRDIAAYHGRRWVTRPRPHVDRLACAWLIRTWIDADAVIRYAEQPEGDELAFDMADGEFTHVGEHCTFEVMVQTFGLDVQPGMSRLAAIVHAIDLRDRPFEDAETAGVDAILRGWLAMDWSDAEREAHGIALFAGLYMGMRSL